MRALEAGRQRLRARVCVEGILTHLSQGWVIVHVLARSEERAVQVMVPVRGHGVVSTAPGTQQAQSIRIGWTGLPLKVEQHGDATFYGGAYRYMHRAGNHIDRSPTFSAGSSPVRTGIEAMHEIIRGGREEEHVGTGRQLERSIENVGTYLIHHPGTSAAIRAFSSSNLRVCPIRRPSMAINVYLRTHPPTHPSKDGTFSIFNVA